MIDGPYYCPRVAVIPDGTPPGERFETHAQTTCCRALAELVKIVDDTPAVTERGWGHVRTDKDQIGAQLLHHIEFPLSSIKDALTHPGRHALKIAERLKRRTLQPQLTHHCPNFAR